MSEMLMNPVRAPARARLAHEARPATQGPRPVRLQGLNAVLRLLPDPRDGERWTLHDDRGLWTSAVSEDRVEHADDGWIARYSAIPARVLEVLDAGILEAKRDRHRGKWVHRWTFNHMVPGYTSDHDIQILFDPWSRRYEVIEEYRSV